MQSPPAQSLRNVVKKQLKIAGTLHPNGKNFTYATHELIQKWKNPVCRESILSRRVLHDKAERPDNISKQWSQSNHSHYKTHIHLTGIQQGAFRKAMPPCVRSYGPSMLHWRFAVDNVQISHTGLRTWCPCLTSYLARDSILKHRTEWCKIEQMNCSMLSLSTSIEQSDVKLSKWTAQCSHSQQT